MFDHHDDQAACREQVGGRHLMSLSRISISCGIGAHEHAAQNGTIVPFNRNQVATPGCADGLSEFEKMVAGFSFPCIFLSVFILRHLLDKYFKLTFVWGCTIYIVQ